MTITRGQSEGRREFVIRGDPIGLGITNSYMALGLARCDSLDPSEVLHTFFWGPQTMKYGGFDYQAAARVLRPELARAKRTGRCRQLELVELLTDAPLETPRGNSGEVRRISRETGVSDDSQGEGNASIA